MSLVTVSIFTIAKGAIFLAKSSAVKVFVAKWGAYLYGHYGLSTTVSLAIKASAIAGTTLLVTSTIDRAKKGYCLILNGLLNRSYSQFCDGVYQLSKAGKSTYSIINEFIDFVDTMNLDSDVKISLKKSIGSLKGIIDDQIEKKGVSLIKEAEDLLRKSSYPNNLYIEKLNAIYYDNTYDLKDNYIELLGRAGRIYSDICNLNILSGLREKESDKYDHYLVYCIAGWMKDHLTLNCLARKSQKEIANDITNQILNYLHWKNGSTH